MERGETLPNIDKRAQPEDAYPDISFDVAHIHLFPEEGEIFEITDTTRLARTLQILGDTCPELATTPKEREQLLQAKKNYLSGKVMTGQHMQEFRKNIINIDYSYSETAKLLISINHPATQLLRQIDAHYNGDQEHDAEMLRLIHNVTTIIAWDQLRTIIDYQVRLHTEGPVLAHLGETAMQPGAQPSDSPAA